MIDFEYDDLISHFIYCTDNLLEDFVILKNMILTKMKKFGLHKSILTILFMSRQHLVSKETEKRQTYKGKRKIENDNQDYEGISTQSIEAKISLKMSLKRIIFSYLFPLRRQRLLSKETDKRQTNKGKLKVENDYQDYDGIITDDLESFLIRLQNQDIKTEDVLSYLRKKLSFKEEQLVEKNNLKHLETYLNPNIYHRDIMNSDARYVHCFYRRRSVYLFL